MDRPTDAATDPGHTREAGDEPGYEALVTRYAPLVFARCRRALGAADADDATQAVFLVLARKRAQAAASPALAAWLLTVADNVIRNARRDLARRRRAEAAAPCPPAAVEADMSDIRDHLDAALADLPGDERTAVQLHLLAGHTLAEVAAHTGAPVSTVHARVQRGLERLRRTLGGRGVGVATLVLTSALMAEAAAAVPPEVMARLREPTAAGGTVGAASVVSARALRWSRQGLTLMQKLLITTAVIAAATIAIQPWSSALDAPVAAVPTPPAGNPPAVVTRPPAAIPTPSWMTVQVTDGARSAERLARLPELELLSATQRGELLAGVASLRAAVVSARTDGEGEFLQDGGLHGWLQATGEQAPVIGAIRGLLDASAAPAGATPDDDALVTVTRDGDAYLLGKGPEHARLTIRGDRIELDAGRAATAPAPAAASEDDVLLLEHAQQPGGDLVERSRMSARITADGMRLQQYARWTGDADEVELAARFAHLQTVPVERFDRLPVDAIVAAVAVLTPASSRASRLFELLDVVVAARPEGDDASPGNGSFNLEFGTHGLEGRVAAYNDATRRRLLLLKSACEQVDGCVATWVQPGVPVPVWSLVTDVSEAGYRDLLAFLERAPDADGVVREGMLSLTWNAGRLVATTHPQGPVAVVESGGFTTHREVQQALAAMPRTGAQVQAILRPTALMGQVQAFAPLVLTAEQQERFGAYHRRVQDEGTFAFLSLGADGQGSHLDAGGILALIAGVIIGQEIVDPALLLQAIN